MKNTLRRVSAFALAVFLVVCNTFTGSGVQIYAEEASAENTCTVTFTVKKGTEAVVGATVVCTQTGETPTEVRGTTTEAGTVALDLIQDKTYTVEAYKQGVGYKTDTYNVLTPNTDSKELELEKLIAINEGDTDGTFKFNDTVSSVMFGTEFTVTAEFSKTDDPEPVTISYSFDSECDFASIDGNGTVTFNSGKSYSDILGDKKITVAATISAGAKYDTKTITKDIVIENDYCDVDFTLKDNEGNLITDAIAKFNITKDGSTTECDAAYSDSKWSVSLKKGADSYSYKIYKMGVGLAEKTIEKENIANDSYNLGVLTLAGVKDDTFNFTSLPESNTLKFGDSFIFDADSTISDELEGVNREITYELVSPPDGIASIDPTTGELTFFEGKTLSDMGQYKTLTVKATISAGTKYATTSKEQVITITEAEQVGFAFVQNEYEFIVGSNNAIIEATGGSGGGEITYKIFNIDGITEYQGTDISIASDGKLTLNGVTPDGGLKIRATKAGDDDYEAAVAECTITVAYGDADSNSYEIKDSNGHSGDEWYNSAVSAHAKDGYKVSAGNATWDDSAELGTSETSEQGQDAVFYVKETTTGNIAKVTENIKIDLTNPTTSIEVQCQGGDKSWSESSGSLDEKLYSSKGSTEGGIEIKGDDTLSGIKNKEYLVIGAAGITEMDENISSLTGWNTVPKSGYITVAGSTDSQIIAVRIEDNAGNVSYVWSSPIIFDTVLPEITLTPVAPTDAEGEKYYNSTSPEINVSVSDNLATTNDNGLSSITYTIEVDETLLSDYENKELTVNNEGKATITIPSTVTDGIVKVIVKAVDKAGNEEEKSTSFVIDTTSPVITAEYDNNVKKGTVQSSDNPFGSEADCYSANRKATFIITEKNFNASDVIVTIKAKDKQKNDITLSGTTLNWNNSEAAPDTYTAEYTFSDEAYYDISLTFTDKAGNSLQETWKDRFVIDKSVPEGTISIDGNSGYTWNSIINSDNVTAGTLEYYAKNCTLNYSFTDSVSSVASVKYITKKYSDIDSYKNNCAADINNISDISEWNDATAVSGNSVESGTIALDNDDGIYVVFFKVTDNAQNTTYISSGSIVIDNTKPVITAVDSSDSGRVIRSKDSTDYYSGTKKMTITYTESYFDADTALTGIEIKKKNSEGSWETLDRTSSFVSIIFDSVKPEATITFGTEGEYQLTLNYTDNAGNAADTYTQHFVIDWTVPSASITTSNSDEKWSETWNDNVSVERPSLIFNKWSKETVNIQVNREEGTSPVYSILYYKTNDTNALNLDDVKALSQDNKWTEYDPLNPISVTSDERFTVYARIEDYSGNVSYIRTGGIILDKTIASETLSPSVAFIITDDGSKIYTGNVSIGVSVTDPAAADGSYSGLKNVRYEVWNDTVKTQEGNLHNFDTSNPTFKDLVKSITKNIDVLSENNNGSNIKVIVYAEDNAGNTSSNSIPIEIDTVNPYGTITVNGNSWTSLLPNAELKHELYYDEDVALSYTAADAVSGLKEVSYLVERTDCDEQTKIYSEAELSAIDASKWTTVDSMKLNAGELTFSDEGSYIVYFRLTDKTDHIYYLSTNNFVVDKTQPYKHNIKINSNVYSDYVARLRFVEIKDNSITITLEGEDAVSDTSMKYYITDNTAYMSVEQLAQVEWIEYNEPVTISDEGIYTVYACYTDKSGNSIYTHSEGYILDRTAPAATVTITDANDINLYSGNVNIKVEAEDPAVYSGIKTIEYDIYVDNVLKDTVTVYNSEKDLGVYSSLEKTKSAEYTIDGSVYNCDNIHLVTRIIDAAGNVASRDTYFDINSTAPVINYTYSGAELTRVIDGYGYYPDSRTVTIDITARTSSFESDKATAGIVVTRDGEPYDITGRISQWVTTEGSSPDQAHHVASILLYEEGYYTFACSYTDKAGNPASSISSASDTPQFFVIDRSKPEGVVTVEGAGSFNSLIRNLTFGIWLKGAAHVNVEPVDKISKIYSVSYFKTPAAVAMSIGQLEKLEDWTDYHPFIVPVNERYTIYVKIEDYAGNVQYISTNGIVSDTAAPKLESIEPEINIEPEFIESGTYFGDVNVIVEVSDPAAVTDGSYSGIKNVRYEVWNDTIKTQEGELYNFTVSNPLASDLEQSVTKNIKVLSQSNNGNNIKVIVYAVDNADNTSSDSITIKIDTVNPYGSVTVNGNTWESLLSDSGLKHELYYDNDVTFSYNAADAVSGIKEVCYMIVRTDRDEQTTDVYTQEQLEELGADKWTQVDSTKLNSGEVLISDDGSYIVYFRLTDRTGHVYYLSTNNFIVDKTQPDKHIIKINDNEYSDYSGELRFVEIKEDNIVIKLEGHDAVSDTLMKYYITDNTSYMSVDQLAQVDWTEYTEPVTISDEGIYTVYACYTDLSGNSIYAHSEGYILDRTAPNAVVSIFDANTINLYKDDVRIMIESEDPNVYSGIKTIEYDIYVDDVLKDTVTVYNSDKDLGVYSNLEKTKNAEYTIDSIVYNYDKIHLVTRVIDVAGNETSKDTYFDINSTAPVINYSYSGAELKRVVKEYGYYPNGRVVTIDITARTSCFEPDKATAGITVTRDGNLCDISGMISQWTTIEGNNPDEAHHIAQISFDEEGYYTFACSYTDRAGNKAEDIYSVSDTPQRFVIDRTKPSGVITVAGVGSYSSLIGNLTFGIWINGAASVGAEVGDKVSPIYSISYYKTPSTIALSLGQLEGVNEWIEFYPFSVPANERYTIYLRIEDCAGNVEYISTNGVISDDMAPVVENIEPEISIVPEFAEGQIYSGDFKVNIEVADPETNDSYSGLKQVWYEVTNMGVVTQSEVLVNYTIVNPSWNELIQQISRDVTISAKDNNSNDVKIIVYAVDNSGNENQEEMEFKIDISEPEIFISYDNNSAVTEYGDSTYFKDSRRAEIEIRERNFDPDKVDITITNTDGVIPVLSEWTTVQGTGNQDDTRNIAYIDYSADGDYTFEIECKDMAGNQNTEVDYGDAVAPKQFTVDVISPVLNVSYNNNEVTNGQYYGAERIATFEIQEHNFDASKAVVTITARNDGNAIDAPAVGNWSLEGDTHVMSVAFSEDGDYTVMVEYTDMAGNELQQIYETEFTVDKTAPVLEITGVADKSANNGEVIPVIELSDTNIDYDTIKLQLVGVNRGGIELDGEYSDIHNGRVFTFNNFPELKDTDDIYTLTAEVTDRAGNTTTNEIMFSVNRFGSTYLFAENAKAMFGRFVQNEEDIVVTEINPNELESIEITLFKNNETILLNEGSDYSVDIEGGEGQWYSYTYTIFKENFTEDGVYRISLYSEDAAKNTSENMLEEKAAEISFGIDKTLPNIIITGVESNRTYPQESKDVIITASDNLKLSGLVVMLNGSEYRRWTEDEIDSMSASNEDFVLTIGESTQAQQLVVTAYDAAGNELTQTVDNFYITTNAWLRFYNNKAAFFGTIGGGITLAGGGTFAVVFRRRRLLKLLAKK